MTPTADVQLGTLELLCRSAELGSFTAGARAVGVTPASASRAVARLEERLGVRLFVRTTRSLRLTADGEAYVARCRRALDELDDAAREVQGGARRATGRVRLTAPTSYAHHRLLPRLPQFRSRFPDVTLELHVGNRNVDLAKEGMDLAIRAHALPESSWVARKLEDAPLVVVAAPRYLALRGVPRSPTDLLQHEAIRYVRPSTGRPSPFQLHVDGQTVEIDPQAGIVCSDDVLACVTLALAGAGITQTFRFAVEEPLRDGRLVELLPEHAGAMRPFYLAHAPGRRLPLRVRALVDFLVRG